MGNICGTKKKASQKERKLKDLLKDPEEVRKIKENAAAQFRAADKDGSGQLDFKEFEQSCIAYNRKHDYPQPTQEQVQQAMAQYDKDRNGKLSLPEYQNMIMDVLKILAELEK